MCSDSCPTPLKLKKRDQIMDNWENTKNGEKSYTD